MRPGKADEEAAMANILNKSERCMIREREMDESSRERSGGLEISGHGLCLSFTIYRARRIYIKHRVVDKGQR